MTRFLAVVAVAGALTLGACGSSTPDGDSPQGTLAGSCDNAPAGFCNEFTGSSYDAASVKRICEGQKLSFLPAECPSARRVGTCLVYEGKSTESYYRYYEAFPGAGTSAGGAAAAAETQCNNTLHGEWTPG